MSGHAVKAALLCAALAIPAAAQQRVHLPAPGETDEWCITPIVWTGQDDDGGLFADQIQQKAYLGVELDELSVGKAKELGILGTKGAVVVHVLPGSPAEAAGLRTDDVVLSVDGKAVASRDELRAAIADKKPGDAVTLEITRAGKQQKVSATLAGHLGGGGIYAAPGGLRAMPFKFGAPGGPEGFGGFDGDGPFTMTFPAGPRLGVSVLPMTDDLRDYFGVEHGKGVLVSAVTKLSPAAVAGIRAGDVILAVDGETVTRAGDVARALAGKSADGSRTIQVDLVRERSRQTVSATVEAPHVSNEE